MVFMFSKGRILGGKLFLMASRNQRVLNIFVLYCCLYCAMHLCAEVLSNSCHIHQGLWFRITGLGAVRNALLISILFYLKSIPQVFTSEG